MLSLPSSSQKIQKQTSSDDLGYIPTPEKGLRKALGALLCLGKKGKMVVDMKNGVCFNDLDMKKKNSPDLQIRKLVK